MSDDQSTGNHDAIEAFASENRRFPPSDAFKVDALITGTELYDEAARDDEGFWARQASELIHWDTEWDTVLDWQLPYAKWFEGGMLNVAYNCLDRHVLAGRGDKIAIHWEGEPGDTRTITYQDLLDEVCRFSNVLKDLGVQKGDRINIYLPMIPEAVVAMLACARIGAVHSVVFGGFSSQSLSDRINDAEAKVLITADGGYRRGEVFPLKPAADEACETTPSIEHVVVVKRGGNDVMMVEARDHWYHELMEDVSPDCPAQPMEAEHLLFLFYTSGTTGKPKGIVHTTGGYLTHTTFTQSTSSTCKPDRRLLVHRRCRLDHRPQLHRVRTAVEWCTQVHVRGCPEHPDNDRFWEIVEKYGVTIFYTAPTAIRAFMKWGERSRPSTTFRRYGCSAPSASRSTPRRGCGTTSVIGGERCPIVDTWWQTETGGIMISPLPGATTTKPGSATLPLPGVAAD